jgi:hypothetical protein
MMWILPKQLHTSHYVQGTAVLISDLNEQSQICEQSLLVRSKPMRVQIWLRKWNKDSWTKHLSGRILKPSLGQNFVEKWTSSLEAIPANLSQHQGSDLERKTQDTCGLLSQMEFESCVQECVSLKTSKDISLLGFEKSLESWKALVIAQRGEYSARQKLVLTIEENVSSLWPTPCASEAQKAGISDKGQMGKSLVAMGNRGELMWPTPRAGNPGSRPNGKGGKILAEEVKKYSTPTARMWKEHCYPAEFRRVTPSLAIQVGGKLNADWVEWLMGIPIGWTDCDSAATELSQQLPH